jgi:hypothetical protein
MLPFVLFPCCRLLRKNDDIVSKADTAAVMEGKLKEKLESMGIAFLCLAEASLVPITSWCMYLYLNVIAVATTLSSLCSHMWVGLGAMINNISDYQTETDCHASSVA